jgi:creatinine amidohydrolase
MAVLPNDLLSVWLHELTWEEVRQYLDGDDIAIVPIGSTEQHGPAGVLGTDTYVAIGLAEDAAKRAGTLVAPPVWYGESSHHMALPGTIAIRAETLLELTKDICRSLARHGFRKIILINGHKGSNLPPLITAAKSLHETELPQVLIAVVDPLHLGRTIAREVKEVPEHHGGELELSQVWYRFPPHVRPDRFPTQGADLRAALSDFGVTDLFGVHGDTIEIPWSSHDQAVMSPSGSLSDSSRSAPEKGRRFHEHMVDNLVRFIEWLRVQKGPIGHTGPDGAIIASPRPNGRGIRGVRAAGARRRGPTGP